MSTGQKNFVAVALFVTLFAALLMASGCSSTLLKSTVDYRAMQIVHEALSDYDKQLDAKISAKLSSEFNAKASDIVRNEVSSMVFDVLPWGVSTLAGGGFIAASVRRKNGKTTQ